MIYFLLKRRNPLFYNAAGMRNMTAKATATSKINQFKYKKLNNLV